MEWTPFGHQREEKSLGHSSVITLLFGGHFPKLGELKTGNHVTLQKGETNKQTNKTKQNKQNTKSINFSKVKAFILYLVNFKTSLGF